MQRLNSIYLHLLDDVSLDFTRYLYEQINWGNRLILLKGPKGVSKTTLLLQHIKRTFILFLSALVAGMVMLVVQPHIVTQIGEGNNFRGLMLTYYSSTAIDTGNETLTNLVQTRGMKGMLSTVFLIFCASAFGGALTGGGMMKSLTVALVRGISGRRSLVATTMGTGLFANMATGDQYLSIVLTGNIYKQLYKDMGFEGRLLSRSTEDSATVTSVLVP